ANGENAGSGGGGSGGSIWIDAGVVTGSGFVQAHGGSAITGGGGGGGRIAILTPHLLLPLSNVTVFGGSGWESGCRGTIYTGVFRGISGRVLLEGVSDARQPVTFELRSGAQCRYVTTLTLGADGSFVLPEVLPGQYTLAVKGPKWLRRVLSVDNTTGEVSGLVLSLLAGDANNDNSVDLLDLDLLVAAFDAYEGDPHWNPEADLNCDGSVDILDLDLLIRNFDLTGDA
ncbi:MAG: dockerin type I domain-containing protein, partial [Chloroherpetonaceae bacterium]|nr:dockerin type I domain-containing protein [Chthonomonadaceae bacterium]MDW8207898.1 dockerin type I domain-containing protein [Chloroherpetonaceae bacterium]